MKTNRFFQVLLSSTFVLAMLLTQSSCNNDDEDIVDTQYTISGNATGSQEVPANASAATGTLSGSYNSSNNTLTYTINWTGMSGNLTAAHFHGPALAGATASPIHDITIATNGVSGNASSSIIIHDTTEAHLLAGKIYYNLHTGTYPGGEIRSQVVVTD